MSTPTQIALPLEIGGVQSSFVAEYPPAVAGCPFCRAGFADVCGRCGRVGADVHVDSVYVGGHGYRMVSFCHDTTACERRRGYR